MIENLWDLNDNDKTELLYPKWQEKWLINYRKYMTQESKTGSVDSPNRLLLPGRGNVKKKLPSIIGPTLVCLKSKIVPSIFMRIIGDMLQFASPLLLG